MIDDKETKLDSVPLSPQLEKDLEVVRKIVSVAMGALLILVAGFAYNIIVGDGLTFVRPSEELLETEQVYKQLINKPSGLSVKV